jgi:hypothetical protein
VPKLGVKVMAAWRRAIELSLGDEDTVKLKSIAESRTEPASRVFEEKMAEVLYVYRQVKILKKAAAASKKKPRVAIISYDEKPDIQAIESIAPDLPPEPGVHATFARKQEYKRHGTVSLLAGIDLVTGEVHALAKDRHRSCEFIEFLKLLDAAYPAHTVKDRLIAAMDYFNQQPIVHTWSFKLDKAA